MKKMVFVFLLLMLFPFCAAHVDNPADGRPTGQRLLLENLTVSVDPSWCMKTASAGGVSSYDTGEKQSTFIWSGIGVLLFALIPGFIARSKGRSFWGYFFLSLLCSPLLSIIISLCVSRLNYPGKPAGTAQERNDDEQKSMY